MQRRGRLAGVSMNIDFKPPPGWHTSTGGMPELIRSTDWASTPIGARDSWSPSLRLAVGIVLASAFPMALRWGPDFVLIYNDAYKPILGDKHPWAFGRPASEVWSEVWAQIAPVHVAILNAKTPAVFAEDLLLRIQRHGSAWEDAHFTLGYSPVEDPTASTGIGGVLVTAVEITDRIVAEVAKQASQERYELALSAPGIIGTWDWDIRQRPGHRQHQVHGAILRRSSPRGRRRAHRRIRRGHSPRRPGARQRRYQPEH